MKREPKAGKAEQVLRYSPGFCLANGAGNMNIAKRSKTMTKSCEGCKYERYYRDLPPCKECYEFANFAPNADRVRIAELEKENDALKAIATDPVEMEIAALNRESEINRRDERIAEPESKEEELVKAIHRQDATIASLKDQHIESERESVDKIVKLRSEAEELSGKVTLRNKRIEEVIRERDSLKSQLDKMHEIALEEMRGRDGLKWAISRLRRERDDLTKGRPCEPVEEKQKPRRMKPNTTLTYSNEHAAEHDENPSCAIGIPCEPVEEKNYGKNYRAMWKAGQMLIERQDNKIVRLDERINKMLFEHSAEISRHNEHVALLKDQLRRKTRRMKPNGYYPAWSTHSVEHSETPNCCAGDPFCEPVEDEKPRRMKGNDMKGNEKLRAGTGYYHNVEHDETHYCGVGPVCEPVEEKNYGKNYRALWKAGQQLIKRVAELVEDVGYRNERIAELEKEVTELRGELGTWKAAAIKLEREHEAERDELKNECDSLKAKVSRLHEKCEALDIMVKRFLSQGRKPRRMKPNATLTHPNEHAAEHDENPSCAIGIPCEPVEDEKPRRMKANKNYVNNSVNPHGLEHDETPTCVDHHPCKPVEDDEPVENKNYRVMWKAGQMLIEIQDKKIVHLYERIDKMLIEHADAISHHNERIFEMVSKEKALVEAIHHQNSKAKTLSTTIVSLKDQHIESERESVDTLRSEIGELKGKVVRRNKRIEERDEHIAELTNAAMDLIAETAVWVSRNAVECGYCNAADEADEGEAPDFTHTDYCPVGTLEKTIKEWRNE